MAIGRIQTDVSLPELGAPDVVKRELTVQENGVLKSTLVLEGATLKDKVLTVETDQDVEVGVTLVDYDDATPVANASEPVQVVFRAVDNVAPILTGELQVLGSREVFPAATGEAPAEPAPEEPAPEEPAPEEPAPEEPVAEEPAEEPVAEEPAVEEPAVEEPVAEEPAEEPVAEEPVAEEPVAEEPAGDEDSEG